MSRAHGSAAKPMFLFVVDTEGDNEWTLHRHLPPVRNLHALPRFQTLCDRYGVRPTYVVTHSVVVDDEGSAMLRAFVDAGCAEVGTHLHPWTTPPWSTAWDDAAVFPSELPEALLEAKIRALTEAITQRFGRAPTSYRAGRFGFDGRSARILRSLGYVVDSSVTPLKSWRSYRGARDGHGGPDFTDAPLAPYRLDHDDPTRSGDGIVEIPLTIVDESRLPGAMAARASALPNNHLASRVLAKLRVHRRLWLRPTLEGPEVMVSACAEAERRGVPVFNMMIHSSELFPNTSPYFGDQRAIDGLFDRIERTFAAIWRRWSPEGLTLTEAAHRLFPVATEGTP